MIQTIFQTPVFFCKNVLSKKENKFLKKISLKFKNKFKNNHKFLSTVYSTHDSYNLINDKNFFNIINIIKEKTKEFSKLLNSEKDYNINNAWINIYKKNNFQEYHNHPDSSFSAVYTIESSPVIDDCQFIIENPSFPYEMVSLQNIKEWNLYNFQYYKFNLRAGDLIIFRSFLKHCVTQKKDNHLRITAAFNLI
jgi:uncharacterized protein (TIGR02466 family)